MKTKKWLLGMSLALLFGGAASLSAQIEEEEIIEVEPLDAEVSEIELTGGVELETKRLASVYFGPDEVQAFIESLAELDAAGSYLRERPGAKLTIRGYAANVGYEGGRKEVSRQRAEYCRRYLQARFGLDADRFLVEWFGSNRPPEGEIKGPADLRCVELIVEEPKIVVDTPVEVDVLIIEDDDPDSIPETGM
jgi:outer membrane protein OmpA-like peptidoglycan-associated protein